jgi:hypothetical protein
MIFCSRLLRARPNRKSTWFSSASHQAISSSRQKPESPRSTMRTFGPLGAQLGHDALDLIERAGGPVDVGRPEPRAQQLIAGEDIQRQ